MIEILRQLICEKPNCEECPKVKTLEKSVEYWKAQRELSYKSSKAKETEITELTEVIRQGNKHISELIDYNVGLIDEIAVMEERIEALKKTKGLFYKTIPNCLRIKNADNKDYVYLGGTFIKLYTNFDVQYRPFKQLYNFYVGITGASIILLAKAGLIDNNTQEIKKGFTAKEVFDKITVAAQYHYSYVGDKVLGFFEDCWFGSVMSIAFQKCDCEDVAIAIVDAFNTYEYLTEPFEDYSAFVGLGYYTYNKNSFGHGYALLIPTSMELNPTEFKNKVYVGEGTSKVGNSRTISELEKSGQLYELQWGIIGTMNEKNLFGGYTVVQDCKYYED